MINSCRLKIERAMLGNRMKQISVLIKPSSSLCNMQCSYCFYKDEVDLRKNPMAKMMDKLTIEAIINKTMALDVDCIHYCFQGGEPTLVGIDFYYYFIDYVSKMNNGKDISYSIQTNGLLLDEKWFDLFSQYQFLVGISIDGFKEIHDMLRKNHHQEGTFDIIMNNVWKIKQRDIRFNILTVLTHQLSKYPSQLYDFYIKNELDNIQLIPCLPSLDESQTNPYALTPQDFFSFYKTFFDLWLEDKGRLSVTLFDNIISMYLGFVPQQCGMIQKCYMQYVIEADGSVYPCDFYALDEYKCGNIHKNTLKEIFNHENAQTFLTKRNEISTVCKTCPFYKMCYGYCKRMNVCLKNDTYCGYQEFLSYSQEGFINFLRKTYGK